MVALEKGLSIVLNYLNSTSYDLHPHIENLIILQVKSEGPICTSFSPVLRII